MSAIPSISPELPGRVAAMADRAVQDTLGRLYQRHAKELERFGEKGRNTCRDDLHHHLDYLQAALGCSDTAPFHEYAVWLGNVLESRGVPVAHLRESLQLLAEFFQAHLAGPDSAAVGAVLDDGLAALSGPAELPAYYRHLPPSLPETDDYLQTLLAGDRLAAQKVALGALDRTGSLVEIGVALVQPAMYEIGRLWQSNRVTVAQEHLATAITQNTLALAFSRADFAPPLNRRALFACVPGNHHSLGLRLVSDAFEVAGWEAQFLGADTPADALVNQIDQWRPELVGLSLSMPRQVETVRPLIDRLRADFGASCPAILIGGLATNQVAGLWKRLGADLWGANARDTVKEAT